MVIVQFLPNAEGVQEPLCGVVLLVVWGLFPLKMPLSKAIPMSHFQVCTHPGRHIHGYPRCTWVRGRGGRLQMRAVSRLPGRDGLFLKLCGKPSWNPGLKPASPSLSTSGGRRWMSVTLHLRQGLSLDLELTSWLDWPPVSPRICLLPYWLWDPRAFCRALLLCGYWGPHSGPHSFQSSVLSPCKGIHEYENIPAATLLL